MSNLAELREQYLRTIGTIGPEPIASGVIDKTLRIQSNGPADISDQLISLKRSAFEAAALEFFRAEVRAAEDPWAIHSLPQWSTANSMSLVTPTDLAEYKIAIENQALTFGTTITVLDSSTLDAYNFSFRRKAIQREQARLRQFLESAREEAIEEELPPLTNQAERSCLSMSHMMMTMVTREPLRLVATAKLNGGATLIAMNTKIERRLDFEIQPDGRTFDVYASDPGGVIVSAPGNPAQDQMAKWFLWLFPRA